VRPRRAPRGPASRSGRHAVAVPGGSPPRPRLPRTHPAPARARSRSRPGPPASDPAPAPGRPPPSPPRRASSPPPAPPRPRGRPLDPRLGALAPLVGGEQRLLLEADILVDSQPERGGGPPHHLGGARPWAGQTWSHRTPRPPRAL